MRENLLKTMENEEIETTDSTNGEESAEDKATRLEDANKKLYARAKKAEGFELKEGKWAKPVKPETPKPEVKPEPKAEGLSEKDIFALVKADVSEDDIDEVKGYASYKKISVAEALKDKTLKGILSDRSEERRSAEVANTKSPRGSSKPSSETLLSKSKEGILPDKDEDIEALAKAEVDAMTKKK